MTAHRELAQHCPHRRGQSADRRELTAQGLLQIAFFQEAHPSNKWRKVQKSSQGCSGMAGSREINSHSKYSTSKCIPPKKLIYLKTSAAVASPHGFLSPTLQKKSHPPKISLGCFIPGCENLWGTKGKSNFETLDYVWENKGPHLLFNTPCNFFKSLLSTKLEENLVQIGKKIIFDAKSQCYFRLKELEVKELSNG